MRTALRPALVLMLAFTAITGFVYPLVVAGIARLAFPRQSEGSLIVRDGRVVGSRLIGQSFTSPRYFWGRLSGTAAFPYDASASSGSNLGPSNPALVAAASARVQALRAADPTAPGRYAVDLLTASGSGLDPDISPAAALAQVARVARARGLEAGDVRTLVVGHVLPRTFGILGEPRVTVLTLNLALDSLSAARNPR
jgi:potassium-transporting ATPase KdpC subunit